MRRGPPHRDQEVADVVVEASQVGLAKGRFEPERDLRPFGQLVAKLERLQDGEAAPSERAESLLRGELQEGRPGEVRDLLRETEARAGFDGMAGPAPRGGDAGELAEQDRLAYAAKPVEELAAVVVPDLESLERDLEVPDLAVASDERRGAPSRPRPIRVPDRIHALMLSSQDQRLAARNRLRRHRLVSGRAAYP